MRPLEVELIFSGAVITSITVSFLATIMAPNLVARSTSTEASAPAVLLILYLGLSSL